MPSGSFPAGFPLPRHPPAANFFGLFGILEIQDHGDVADVTFDGGGNVGVAPVEGKSMNTFARGLIKRDLPWFGSVRDVKNFKTRLQFLFCFITLIVDEHDITADAHL